MARIVEVIHVTLVRGKGIEEDPTRRVQQIWTKSGKLLDEFDPIYIDDTESGVGWYELQKEERYG